MTFATGIGSMLAGGFDALGRIRPTAKPLHPRGVVQTAVVERHGSTVPFGVPWLDEPGRERALVRFSRSVGLPARLPDVLGLALRVDLGGRPADLLFATAGRGVPGRFVLRPRVAPTVSPTTYSTLQPYRSPHGAVVLSATPWLDGTGITVRLAAARATGPWQEFGSVLIDEGSAASGWDDAGEDDDGGDEGHDIGVSFDAILNEIPGLPNYRWVREVREGAYRAARRSRERPLM